MAICVPALLGTRSGVKRWVRTQESWIGGLILGMALLAIASGAGAEPLAAGPPAAAEIRFEGNAGLSAAALRQAAAAELADFEQRGERRSDIDDAAFQMEQAYQREGFAFARVDYEIERGAGRATVTFHVSEGPQVLVGEIRISGHQAIDLETLQEFFRPEAFGLLPQVRRPFVRAEIDAAVAAMRDYYRGRGFLDAAVEGPEVTFSADRRRADIDVRVNEGVQHRVKALTVHGDVPAVALTDVEELQRTSAGQPYTSRTRLVVRARLAEIFGGLGFPDAAVSVAVRTEPASGAVELVAEVVPGPRVTIAAVEVRGTQRTRPAFVHERVQLKPGDPYDLAREKESFNALYRAGVFSKVEIHLEKTDAEDRRILVVTVTEMQSQEVFIEPGYGSYEQLRLVVGYRLKNLFGTGRFWTSEALTSVKAQGVSSTLTDPWFLGTDLRADLTGFLRRREEPSFTRRDAGGSFFLNKELSPRLTVNSGLTFRRTDLSDSAAVVEEEDLRADYNFASVKAQATYDTRNDIFFPTTGQRTFGAAERADTLLGGDVTFLRLTGGTRLFFPFSRTTVLGLRYVTGLIIPGEDEFTVPLAERFFNGGENTVRSFKEAKLGPRDSSGDPAGGLGYNVLSVELRQRLIGDFTGTLFADIGNVAPNRTREDQGQPPYRNRSQILSDTLGDFFKGFRSGVGAGLQYLLPVGPARLDVALNPDRDEKRNEDRYVVHFSVGMAF
jgi:outer membrane protein assembly complex protein YaeT